MMLSPEYALAIASDKSLRGRHFRVLFYLLGTLDTDEWRLISLTELAELLSQEKDELKKLLIELVDEDYLQRGEKVGKDWTYRLPSWAPRG